MLQRFAVCVDLFMLRFAEYIKIFLNSSFLRAFYLDQFRLHNAVFLTPIVEEPQKLSKKKMINY